MKTRGKHQLLTVREVADLLRVDVVTVRRWLKAGKLKGFKLGWKSWRVWRKDLPL